MTTKRKPGRPSKAAAERVVKIGIAARHLRMIDEAIYKLEAGSPAFIEETDGRAGLGLDDPKTAEAVAARRRQFLGRLIERRCSFEALNQTCVRIVAPLLSIGDEEMVVASFRDAAEWMAYEEVRLTAEAPAAVQAALHVNRIASDQRGVAEKDDG